MEADGQPRELVVRDVQPREVGAVTCRAMCDKWEQWLAFATIARRGRRRERTESRAKGKTKLTDNRTVTYVPISLGKVDISFARQSRTSRLAQLPMDPGRVSRELENSSSLRSLGPRGEKQDIRTYHENL